MKNDLLPTIIVLVSLIVGAIFYNSMPETMAAHWNAAGGVDGYMQKEWTLFTLPILMVVLYLLFEILPEIDPLKKNVNKFRSEYDKFVTVVLGFLLYVYVAVILWNLGIRGNMVHVVVPGLSVLFYFTGEMLSKARRNWFIGIRTPWTMSSERVWNKTHKLGSSLFKVYAVLIILSLFFPGAAFYMVIITAISICVLLFVYSYLEYKKKK